MREPDEHGGDEHHEAHQPRQARDEGERIQRRRVQLEHLGAAGRHKPALVPVERSRYGRGGEAGQGDEHEHDMGHEQRPVVEGHVVGARGVEDAQPLGHEDQKRHHRRGDGGEGQSTASDEQPRRCHHGEHPRGQHDDVGAREQRACGAYRLHADDRGMRRHGNQVDALGRPRGPTVIAPEAERSQGARRAVEQDAEYFEDEQGHERAILPA